jgi:hypothetical protein
MCTIGDMLPCPKKNKCFVCGSPEYYHTTFTKEDKNHFHVRHTILINTPAAEPLCIDCLLWVISIVSPEVKKAFEMLYITERGIPIDTPIYIDHEVINEEEYLRTKLTKYEESNE